MTAALKIKNHAPRFSVGEWVWVASSVTYEHRKIASVQFENYAGVWWLQVHGRHVPINPELVFRKREDAHKHCLGVLENRLRRALKHVRALRQKLDGMRNTIHEPDAMKFPS